MTEMGKDMAEQMASNGSEEHAIAHQAGLRYVNDGMPGIRRVGSPGRFSYRDAAGKAVRDAVTLARIRALVIPPAWTDVWVCAFENGHLQATGRDAKRRKQYRYHSQWQATRDANKFENLKEFARALPRIRRATRAYLDLPGLPREKVLAAVVSLLEATLIRVGNEKYARDNGSFGLTTMRNRHIKVRGQKMQFDFRGKSGKVHHIELISPRLAAIVRKCRELPGQELFQYVDEQGLPQIIDSSDVNEFLSAVSGGAAYTAKDFRTWAGTVLAALALRRMEAPASDTHRKRVVAQAISAVAEKLGNTPAICRKCYVHPAVIAAYPEGLGRLPEIGEAAFSTMRINRNHELGVLEVLIGDAKPLKRKAKSASRAVGGLPAGAIRGSGAKPNAVAARAA